MKLILTLTTFIYTIIKNGYLLFKKGMSTYCKFIIGKDESIPNKSRKEPSNREIRNDDFNWITEINSKVPRENRSDY
jgi:hypothetical protein